MTTQSYSFNKPGNDRMTEIIAAQFENSSMACEFVPQEKEGDHLLVRTPAAATSPSHILLTGHTDTVFPEDTAFTDFTRADGLCRGPGVIDMKGGLVAGIFALKSLEAVSLLKDMPIVFVFNCDEEIGSPTSGPIIRREARKALFAFVLECGGLQGEIVTGRKGNMAITLETFGKAGHAASAVKDKASAILELAHKIVAVEALNDPERKISVNAAKSKAASAATRSPTGRRPPSTCATSARNTGGNWRRNSSELPKPQLSKGQAPACKSLADAPPCPKATRTVSFTGSWSPPPRNWESR